MHPMKKIFSYYFVFFAAFFLFPSLAQAQFEIGIGYLNSNPSGAMGSYITRSSHGLSMDLAYRIPKTNLSVGIQFAGSEYGFERREETYRFANGYEGNVNVEVSNFFTNNSLYLKYDILDNVFAQPYLLFGGGFSSFSTELSITDPREEFTSDCPKPLETTTLISDRTGYLLLGGGLRFDLSYAFKSLERRNVLFDVRLTYLNGGEVRYMSLNEPNITPTTVGRENVLFNFASTAQPDIIHEYHAGSSYRSSMQFVTLNAGIIIVPGKWDWDWLGF